MIIQWNTQLNRRIKITYNVVAASFVGSMPTYSAVVLRAPRVWIPTRGPFLIPPPSLSPTQLHLKYVPLNTILQHRYSVPYCTFHGSFKVKHPVSGAKTLVQCMTLTDFCYVEACIVLFITLFKVRIVVALNSNTRWVSLKRNALSCRKYPPHQTQA